MMKNKFLVSKYSYKFSIFIFFVLLIYLVASGILFRGIFISEVDGFYYQILNVSSGGELGVLNLTHSVRYFVVFPFVFIEKMGFSSILSSMLQSFILFIYLSPIFFWKRMPRHVRVLSVGLLLFFSLLFSYRTVLLMESVFIMAAFIRWGFFQFKYFLYSVFLGVLSSGVVGLLVILLLVLIGKNKHFNKKNKKLILFFIFILFLLLLPSLAHKLLFYSNPNLFGSASSVEIFHILNLSLNDVYNIFDLLFERSLIYEALNDPSFFYRVYILITVALLSILFLIISPGSLSITFVFFTMLGSFMEGLILYSLIFILFVLNYDFFYRRLRF